MGLLSDWNLFGQSHDSTTTNNDNRTLTDNRNVATGGGMVASGGSTVNVLDGGSIASAFGFGSDALAANQAAVAGNAELLNKSIAAQSQMFGGALEFGRNSVSQALNHTATNNRQSLEAVSNTVSKFGNLISTQNQANRQLAEKVLNSADKRDDPDGELMRLALMAGAGVLAIMFLVKLK